MKALVCELCGSNEMVKQDGFFVCQSCGTKYSPEEARKLIVEGNVDVSGSTVKVDNAEKLSNLYQLARRAREDNNSANAQKYYEQIALEDPNSWEAVFFGVYYTAMNCKIGQIGNAAYSVKNNISSTFDLIKKHVPESEQKIAYRDVSNCMQALAMVLINGSMGHYSKNREASGISTQVSGWNASVLSMLETLGDKLNSIFEDKEGAASSYKAALQLMRKAGSLSGVMSSWESLINKKIVALDSSYQKVVDREKIQRLEVQSKALKKTKSYTVLLAVAGICLVVVGVSLISSSRRDADPTFTMLMGGVFALIGIVALAMIPVRRNVYNNAMSKAGKIDAEIENLKKEI